MKDSVKQRRDKLIAQGFVFCRMKDCPNFGASRGINKETGKKSYRSLCRYHLKNGRPLKSTFKPYGIDRKIRYFKVK